MSIVESFLDLALLGSAWVLWLLVILSILSIAIIFERSWYFSKLKLDFAEFNKKLLAMLQDGKYKEACEYCEASPAIESQTAARGLEVRSRGAKSMEENMGSFVIGERQHLDRGLIILGTLGNNAPFVGLFGTVLGIIQAFNSLKTNPAGGPSVVMAGISEALVATAVGILVAIPAVVAFNLFSRIVKRRIANAESVMKLIVAHAEK